MICHIGPFFIFYLFILCVCVWSSGTVQDSGMLDREFEPH